MSQWIDIARMRDKYNQTGECDYCENEGLVMGAVMHGGHQVLQGYPCNVCGQRHGYNEYVKNKYAEGTFKACHIVDNLYAFPHDRRNVQMDNEFFGNGGRIPIKSHKGNNVILMKDYR